MHKYDSANTIFPSKPTAHLSQADICDIFCYTQGDSVPNGLYYNKTLEGGSVLNNDIATLRFDILKKESKWLSDYEAAELLQSQK